MNVRFCVGSWGFSRFRIDKVFVFWGFIVYFIILFDFKDIMGIR